MNHLLHVDDKLPLLPALFARYPEIVAVFLFGSYGTEYQHPGSDIDLAVYFSRQVSLALEADLLGEICDILRTDRVDLVNLNKAPLPLQFKAVSQGRLIYEADYIATCDYIESLLKQYHDFAIDLAFFYRDYDLALKEAIRENGG
ncbi:MAG TPA: nucleotidyltransferase domain-containing protein [Clostridia bacterium]|nr:nucleotidyltransferase domain-containing protein [Clostridia bacterium]